MEADVMSAFREISLNRVELTPQEKVLAYEPKNAYEAKIKDLTIFKHKALDFMNRYPEAADTCFKLISRVAQGWQVVKYAGAAVGGMLAGGIVGATAAVSGVYAIQTATETAIDTTVTTTSNALATQITSDNVLQKEFASTIKICELGLLCAGSTKAFKALRRVVKTEVNLLPAPVMHKHHIFPKKFKPFFEQLGITIDDHCIALGGITHSRGVHGTGNLGMMPGNWNMKWRHFIENNPNATRIEVYQFGGQLLDEFGIGHLSIIKYK
jgi:hypothetical protein